MTPDEDVLIDTSERCATPQCRHVAVRRITTATDCRLLCAACHQAYTLDREVRRQRDLYAAQKARAGPC